MNPQSTISPTKKPKIPSSENISLRVPTSAETEKQL